MVEDRYKTQMEFNNSDFNADKSKQYEAVLRMSNQSKTVKIVKGI